MDSLTWAGLDLSTPKIMGILNVTPDSFSDGGRFFAAEAAIARGREMLAAGADILDIGGESTKPGAAAITPEEEIARLMPVLQALAGQAVISVDTRNAATMAAALTVGARIINDVSGLRHDPKAAALVAEAGCPVILMHMRGSPMTMNCQAHYADVTRDVMAELVAIRDAAEAAGIKAANIALDPGLGFAKAGAQNLELLREVWAFTALGHPLVIGASRKRFVGEFGGEPDAMKRFPASLAAGLFALGQGAQILRVHDVAETVQGVKMWQQLTNAPAGSGKAV
ncbi:MAG: dihydropteroate synthase [Acidocella sp. 20-57-95]|nr:MAG: dihydropteroate synthase [Acidocella sp. 20-57-95]OYV59480.1 MAG: dihydropteroate synthase [Acidocella sp. 21-58-7]HQT64899.1 dihydropteroate synthase [Acidocella sp.]HQU04888.1 dihydropteroate synthase [Acidocella sp.]